MLCWQPEDAATRPRYKKMPNAKPIVVVPTTYNHVTEEEFAERGVQICIYANHLLRAASAFRAVCGIYSV